jgi:uncharacterized membrane protein YgcG
MKDSKPSRVVVLIVAIVVGLLFLSLGAPAVNIQTTETQTTGPSSSITPTDCASDLIGCTASLTVEQITEVAPLVANWLFTANAALENIAQGEVSSESISSEAAALWTESFQSQWVFSSSLVQWSLIRADSYEPREIFFGIIEQLATRQASVESVDSDPMFLQLQSDVDTATSLVIGALTVSELNNDATSLENVIHDLAEEGNEIAFAVEAHGLCHIREQNPFDSDLPKLVIPDCMDPRVLGKEKVFPPGAHGDVNHPSECSAKYVGEECCTTCAKGNRNGQITSCKGIQSEDGIICDCACTYQFLPSDTILFPNQHPFVHPRERLFPPRYCECWSDEDSEPLCFGPLEEDGSCPLIAEQVSYTDSTTDGTQCEAYKRDYSKGGAPFDLDNQPIVKGHMLCYGGDPAAAHAHKYPLQPCPLPWPGLGCGEREVDICVASSSSSAGGFTSSSSDSSTSYSSNSSSSSSSSYGGYSSSSGVSTTSSSGGSGSGIIVYDVPAPKTDSGSNGSSYTSSSLEDPTSPSSSSSAWSGSGSGNGIATTSSSANITG